MQKKLSFATALFAAAVLSFTTACVSGGFAVTRSFSRFVNGQKNILLRAIVFILTAPVYVVTLIIDLVIYNTIDFWEGKVAAGDYKFQKDQKTFYAHHEITPDKRKRSIIKIEDQNGKLLQTVALSEMANGEIEMTVDGVKRAQIRNVNEIPSISFYRESGAPIAENLHIDSATLAATNPDSGLF